MPYKKISFSSVGILGNLVNESFLHISSSQACNKLIPRRAARTKPLVQNSVYKVCLTWFGSVILNTHHCYTTVQQKVSKTPALVYVVSKYCILDTNIGVWNMNKKWPRRWAQTGTWRKMGDETITCHK